MLSISPFLVIDDNTSQKWFEKVQVNSIHKAQGRLEIELWIYLPNFLKIIENRMDKFLQGSRCRENSPLICACKIWIFSLSTYMRLEILAEFPLQKGVEAYKIHMIEQYLHKRLA